MCMHANILVCVFKEVNFILLISLNEKIKDTTNDVVPYVFISSGSKDNIQSLFWSIELSQPI